MSYLISGDYLEFATFLILTYCQKKRVEFVGSFLKNFQNGVGRYRNSEVLVILYFVFVAAELHSDTTNSNKKIKRL